MAHEFLIADWTLDRGINSLDANAERFYLRLCSQVDDCGIFHAEILILKSRLFPLLKQIRDTDIALWLAACEKAGLVRCYNAFNSRNKTRGEPYVAVLNFLNRKKRIKSEHPPPEGQIPLLSGVEEKRREEKTTRAWTVEKEFPEANVPTWPEVKTYAEMHGVPEKCALSFFEHHHNNNLWCNQFDRLIKWQSKLVSWSNNDRQQKGNYAGRNIGKNNSQSANRNTGTLNEGTADQYRGVGRVVPISDV